LRLESNLPPGGDSLDGSQRKLIAGKRTAFAIIMLIIIVILLIPVAVHRCQVCEENGGIYCKLGPRRGW
jgi:hypothetical protein